MGDYILAAAIIILFCGGLAYISYRGYKKSKRAQGVRWGRLREVRGRRRRRGGRRAGGHRHVPDNLVHQRGAEKEREARRFGGRAVPVQGSKGFPKDIQTETGENRPLRGFSERKHPGKHNYESYKGFAEDARPFFIPKSREEARKWLIYWRDLSSWMK